MTTSHYGGALWTGEDQMPSCAHCLDGNHPACPDLVWTEPWGLHACGCGNAVHEEEGL